MRWCNPCMHVTPFTRNLWPAFWVFGKILPGVSRTRKPEPELLLYATDGCTDTVIHTSPRLVTCHPYLKLLHASLVSIPLSCPRPTFQPLLVCQIIHDQ